MSSVDEVLESEILIPSENTHDDNLQKGDPSENFHFILLGLECTRLFLLYLLVASLHPVHQDSSLAQVGIGLFQLLALD